MIEGMLDGDQEAFDAFYAETKETVEKACSYFLGEDTAMVTAFLGAYGKAFHQISLKQKPDMPPKAWMSVLAVQECFPVMLRYRDDYDSQTKQMEEMAAKVPVLQEITN